MRKPNTVAQKAMIRASVEAANQVKRHRGQQIASPWRSWNPRRGRQQGVHAVDGSWWIGLSAEQFYVEARARALARDAISRSYRAPDELGIA